MHGRILAMSRTVGILALAVALCLVIGTGVQADAPLPNVWINLYGLNSTYLGQPVPVGAQIVAFDAQTGVQCGEFTVTHEGWYGTMPCYGDDGVYPGATPGHALSFEINGAAAETEAVSLNGAIITSTSPVIWDQSLSTWEVDLHARLDVAEHTLASSANPSELTQTVTFTTKVTGAGPSGQKPTGSVRFDADDALLGVVALDASGQASIGTADLMAGLHTITATYQADTVFYSSTVTLTQVVRSAYEERCELTTGSYEFSNSGPVSVEIGEVGSLFCLRVQHVAGDHPHATPGISTGQYWIISGTDTLGQPAAGFGVTLTLPVNTTPDANDKLCRYSGAGQVWDCGASSFDGVGQTISRANVVSFSDWAVGDDVNPNSVELRDLQARRQGQQAVWLLLALGLTGLGATGLIRRRSVWRGR